MPKPALGRGLGDLLTLTPQRQAARGDDGFRLPAVSTPVGAGLRTLLRPSPTAPANGVAPVPAARLAWPFRRAVMAALVLGDLGINALVAVLVWDGPGRSWVLPSSGLAVALAAWMGCLAWMLWQAPPEDAAR